MLWRFTLPPTGPTLLAAAALAVCLAPLRAQEGCGGPLGPANGPLADGAGTSAAKVIYQTGQVSLQIGASLQVVCVGSVVKAQQSIVTGPDGFAKLQVFSDGSTFEVYPNSRVVFRETPGSWEHLLNVWLGRVKVFIQHAPGVPNPNNVTSPTAVISVRGTVFDVVVDDQGTTFVTVDEGLVDVRNWTAPGRAVSLHPGESITVIRGQSLIGNQIDHSGWWHDVLLKARDVFIYAPRPGASGPSGGGVPAGNGGAQGDKSGGKGGTSGPGAPPAPPGGGG
jgi:ferric-dicitrate binding protein FerR (iron transport regulator)